MGDVFKEQLIKQLPSTKTTLIKGGVVLLGIILLFLSMSFAPGIMPIVLVAICFGIYYVFGMFNIEYEYVLTNGELDIDAIYGKSRRKRIFSGELNEVEIMCHVTNLGYEGDFRTANEKKDCSTGKVTDNTYMFLTSYKGKKMKITFEPNNDMIKSMFPYLGQRKFIKKV